MKPKNNNFIYIAIVVVVVAGAVWAGAKFLGKSNGSNNGGSVAGANNQRGQFGQGRGRGNFKPLSGTIQSISGQTIAMKADDGSAKNITVADTTRIMKQDNGQRVTLTIADLKVSDKINIMSDDNTKTDITARMIMVGDFTPPQGGFRPGGSGGYGGQDSQGTSSPDFSSGGATEQQN